VFENGRGNFEGPSAYGEVGYFQRRLSEDTKQQIDMCCGRYGEQQAVAAPAGSRKAALRIRYQYD